MNCSAMHWVWYLKVLLARSQTEKSCFAQQCWLLAKTPSLLFRLRPYLHHPPLQTLPLIFIHKHKIYLLQPWMQLKERSIDFCNDWHRIRLLNNYQCSIKWWIKVHYNYNWSEQIERVQFSSTRTVLKN